jgi:Ala-tRNA(Pro) deacylase
MNEALEAFLAARLAKYALLRHEGAPTSSESAAAADVSGWQWAKVVVVKHPHGFALAVLPACCEMDLDRLKGLVGEGDLRLASVEEVLRLAPGCELGALPPFGRFLGVPTFAEEALVNQREVVLPAGNHRTALRMRAAEYVRLAEPRVGRFAVHGGEFPVRPPLGPRRRARPAAPRTRA